MHNEVHVMLIDMYRKSQRILHIPFFPPSCGPSPQKQLKYQAQLKQARKGASASVGLLIQLGSKLRAPSAQKELKDMMPQICKRLPGVHLRVQNCYAQLLVVADLVSFNNTVAHILTLRA